METSEAQKWREYQEWRREAHDAEVRRAEWERMYHQAVTDAGERVASLEAALEQIARWGSGEAGDLEPADWEAARPFYEASGDWDIAFLDLIGATARRALRGQGPAQGQEGGE